MRAEVVEHLWVPAVGLGQDIAVPLQVGAEAADEFAQAGGFALTVVHHGQHRPDADCRGVAIGGFGGTADGVDGVGGGVVGEEGVQDDGVGDLSGETQGVVADRGEGDRNGFVVGGVQVQDRVFPGGPVVPDDGLAAPESSVELGGVAQLGGGDPR